jgi:hypothetical protein
MSTPTDRVPEPLTLTVHSLATPRLDGAADDSRRLRGGRIKMLLVLLACAAPVIASYFTYYVIRPEGRTNHGALIQPSRAMPEALALATLTGERVAARSLHGQWLLVSVGPAACGTACEQRLYAQRQLREMLGRDAERLDKLWLVTDTAPIAEPLRRALDTAPAFNVLRADAAALAAWLEPASGQRVEDHLYVVDPMGEWMMRFPATIEPAKIKRDLSRLMRASNSWDQAGR